MNQDYIPRSPTYEEIEIYYRDYQPYGLPMPLGPLPESESQSEVIQPPNLIQKAVNLSRAVTRHIAAGLPHADEETVTHRLEVCHACENFDAAHSKCCVCGCNMQIKVSWAEQQCPIGKW